jgi:hypothetical protein
MSLTTAIAKARGDCLDSEQNVAGPAPARRVEEGDGVRAELAKTSRSRSTACAALIEELGEIAKTKEASQKVRALLVLDLVDEIRKLGYQDYRMAVGLINQCRADASGKALDSLIRSPEDLDKASPGMARFFGIVSHLVGSLSLERNANLPVAKVGPQRDEKLYADCAEHVMLLLRSAYSLGVNIRNASWQKAAGPTSYSTENMVGLWLGKDHCPRRESGAVVIKPSRNSASVVRYVPHGKTWDQVEEFAVLKSGESVVIGRPLELPSELLGVKLGKVIEVPVGVRINDSSWSRGGLLVCRDEEGSNLYVFDCGMRQPIVRPDEVGGVESYVPRTIVAGGRSPTISFGESVVFRAKRPHLE